MCTILTCLHRTLFPYLTSAKATYMYPYIYILILGIARLAVVDSTHPTHCSPEGFPSEIPFAFLRLIICTNDSSIPLNRGCDDPVRKLPDQLPKRHVRYGEQPQSPKTSAGNTNTLRPLFDGEHLFSCTVGFNNRCAHW
jgi:hypothetical protein